MRPALSVILLTTLIGAGQGLFLALFTVQSYALVGLLPPPASVTFYVHGGVMALVLLGAGLAASFFHLGRPERAWRSATTGFSSRRCARAKTRAGRQPSCFPASIHVRARCRWCSTRLAPER